MGWRRIVREDIELGTIIRMTRLLDDGGYGMATIVALHLDEKDYPHVRVCRPMVYAHEAFNSNGLVGTEVIDLGVSRMIGEHSDVEVFETTYGLRRMAT